MFTAGRFRPSRRNGCPPPKEETFPLSTDRLKIGDRVRIESLRSEGILLKIEEPEDRVEVMTEKGKVKASLSDIVKVSEEKEAKEADSEAGVDDEGDSSGTSLFAQCHWSDR